MRDFLATLRLCPGALFLHDEAYAAMRDTPRPFLKGLILLLAVGLAVSLVAVVGETLEWATTPDLGAIKDVVLQRLQQMDWYREASEKIPNFESTFRQQYDLGWRVFPYLFGAPNPFKAAVGVIVTPLWLGVSWLVFGLLGYAFARLLGGQASLAQTLGCTALAVTPQMLRLIRILPYVEIGGVIATWTLICNYLAIRNAHRLTSRRAFWATLLPLIILALLALALAGLGVVLGLTIVRGGK